MRLNSPQTAEKYWTNSSIKVICSSSLKIQNFKTDYPCGNWLKKSFAEKISQPNGNSVMFKAKCFIKLIFIPKILKVHETQIYLKNRQQAFNQE